MAKRRGSGSDRAPIDSEKTIRDRHRDDQGMSASPDDGDGSQGISEWQQVYDAARPRRLAGASERKAARQNELNVIEEHARESARQDELAWQRDLAAEARDRAAERRDRAMLEREEMMAKCSSVDAALGYAANLRADAASERAMAADDRRQAALDRLRAAEERTEALAALKNAHLDDLTGAYRRGIGEHALRGEIDRAHRSGDPLVFAILDVDGLKQVNDRHGHLAGDRLLCDVVASVQANIRSYEPIVRLGGDEFAFTIAGLDLEGARTRIALMRADLARRPSEGKFTIGVTELLPEDGLGDLIARADRALVQARGEHRPGPS